MSLAGVCQSGSQCSGCEKRERSLNMTVCPCFFDDRLWLLDRLALRSHPWSA